LFVTLSYVVLRAQSILPKSRQKGHSSSGFPS
jgi:hypothetical protein